MYGIFKRAMDLAVALVLLICVSPIIILAALALAVANNGAIFFIQSRPGWRGRIFKIVKFKTMNDKKDVHGILLPDDKRMTKVGELVRKLSLDELPQLINVVKGEMSIVGPRPLLVDYLGLYNVDQARRHEVRPGITGWAQVNGRNAISWKKRLELDVWYVDHQSFWLDIKIMWMTVLKVIKREGVSAEGMKTMPRFTGDN
ncbi:MAG: sugar transferase [Bacteroidetes bacterium]|nr:sugar transferase [Bacteroidota bacterium]